MTVLTHWSSAPLEDPYSVEPRPRDGEIHSGGKPVGLWLSDETTDWGWRAWCEAESFGADRLIFRSDFSVDLSDVAVIRSNAELYAFSDKYLARAVCGRDGIDWCRVGADFKGLLITPYLHECRFDVDWYYGWDCASGCFWDVSCLSRIPSEAAA